MKIAVKRKKDGKRMNKKIIGIVVALLFAVMGVGGYFLFHHNDKINETKKTPSNSPINENTDVDNDQDNAINKTDATLTAKGKILVVYYSASGSTKKVAEEIANNLNADLFEIMPEDIYTSEDLNWTNENSRVSREHENKSLRDVKLKSTKVENWKSYDIVLIGYPIWWGIAAWPVDTFVENNNFDGKTVIPFCTSASSELGQSGKLLEEEATGGNWLEGMRFSSRPTDNDIKTFTDSIK